MKQWHCNACGLEWNTDDDIAAHFHPCRPRYPRRYLEDAPRWWAPDLEGTTLEEAWARTFSGFAGGYQPPTLEQAREETGESGRRREGTGRRPPPDAVPIDDPWIRELDL